MAGKRIPVLVEASDGEWYAIKLGFEPAERRLIVNEFIDANLLRFLGVSAPYPVPIQVTLPFLNENRAGAAVLDRVAPGLYLGSRYPPPPAGVFDYLPSQLLPRVTNLGQLWKVFVIDHWTGRVGDRRVVFTANRKQPGGQYDAVVIPCGGIFGRSSWTVNGSRPDLPTCLSSSDYLGLNTEALTQEAISSILDFPPEELLAIWRKAPSEWYAGEQEAFYRLSADLIGRRVHLPHLLGSHSPRTSPRTPPRTSMSGSGAAHSSPKNSAIVEADAVKVPAVAQVDTLITVSPRLTGGPFLKVLGLLLAMIAVLIGVRLWTLPKIGGGGLSYEQYRVYREAQDDLQRLRPDPARDRFKELTREAPGFARGYLGLAEADILIFEDGKQGAVLMEAQEALDGARRRGAAPDDLLLPEARLSLAQGHASRCVTLLAQLAPHSGSDDLHRILSRCYGSSGQWQQALSESQRAIRINPSDWRNHNAHAINLVRTNHLPEAEAEYRRVLDFDPHNASVLSNLGGVYLQLGRYAQAVVPLTRALDLAPSYPAFNNLATAYYRMGHCAVAEALFRKALDLRPQGTLIAYIAETQRCQGDEDGAAASQVRAIRALEREQGDMKTDEGQALLALAYARVGRLSEADSLVRRLSGLSRRQDLVLYATAITDLSANKTAQALQDLGSALRKGFPADSVAMDPSWRRLRQDPRYQALVHSRIAMDTQP